MKIYNTMTRQKEIFSPIVDGEVKMYCCGPTVYNLFHIGNARPFIIFDTLKRYFEYKGLKVTYVQNFTDIDDKIIRKSKEEGVSEKDLSQKYINEYFKDIEGLKIRKADYHPKVTEHIDDILKVIESLDNNGLTYTVNGDVYYDTSKFERYGKLSKQNIDELESGARVDINDVKRNPTDFVLWKAQKPGEPAWKSKWGMGRPGWHIECSAMAMKYLGETIDIHSGGQDLIFPHHENEIAQSEGATGKTFANFWMHNGFININNEKMSKSLGNFSTVRDISKIYDLEIVRMFMLSAHYRNPINFSTDLLEQTKNALDRLYNAKNNLIYLLEKAEVKPASQEEEVFVEKLQDYKLRFMQTMDDDLNTADAISVIFDLVREINTKANDTSSKQLVKSAFDMLMELSRVLGLLQKEEENINEKVESLIERRQQARKEKNWTLADKIRDDLKAEGIMLEDTPQGVKWRKI